ncbi:cob(I)yrinic acid a,c-diamide adenosyltransferase [Elstera cyanobacteriorum]|uniref:cob(I)yrinic acid a,c-diamide adenosyltransferase n=1 Tax=Elstera cyanobacteriorum TaxID=2022747 RepID=UPI0023552BDF|nr:cob(I)yrinic acid a,c-diamide adenosyltransferase [Elstera cyanobacteriorum]MCK6441539.1 cob(I)yrinic acid a,c-diamide adenosyltransferase [Elstera cyanobacteriorum]
MVRLTKIYTRGGDKGETSLSDGTRVAKDDLRVETYGTVDECSSALGIARLHADPALEAILARIQNDLFDLGADLACPVDQPWTLRVTQAQVDWLEATLDGMNDHLKPLDSFILPGGTPCAAYLHLARTIARRAERQCVTLMRDDANVNSAVLRYLNRLSDLLFVAARWVNDKGTADILWVPGQNRAG